jgi:DNA-binding CsgD family transcriptional regulator
MKKNRAVLMSRAAGFLTLLNSLLLIYLTFALSRYLPAEKNAMPLAAYVMNFAGMILGGLLCPLFMPLPLTGNPLRRPCRRKKPPALSVAGIVLAALPNLIIRPLGINVWLSPAARLLVALSSGVMIAIGYGLFFLTWGRQGGLVREGGKWRAITLVYSLALITAILASHYSLFLMEQLGFGPERIRDLLFAALKWMMAGFCVFAAASVCLYHAAAPASGDDTAGAAVPETWGPYGILRMYALLSVWEMLNAILLIRGIPLITNQEWSGLQSAPAAALIVLALNFIAGFSPEKTLRICLPPAVTLFIFMPSLAFFSAYPRFTGVIIFLVSLADMTMWILFAVNMAESCQKADRFYLCSILSVTSSSFAIIGRILGPEVSGGMGFTTLMIASETVAFLFLALPLMFPKTVPAAEGSAADQKASPERLFAEYGLTEREREVAALMLEGLDNDAIGDKLCISNPAVRYHVGNIYGKFGVDGKRGGRAAFLAKVIQPEDHGGGGLPIPNTLGKG